MRDADKNKTLWLAVVVAATMVALLVLGGCNMLGASKQKQNSKDTPTIEESVDAFLQEKYGPVEYELIGVIPRGFAYPYDIINAIPEGGDEDTDLFTVWRYHRDDGYEFADNYYWLLIRGEVAQRCKEVAQEHFTKFGLYSRADLPHQNNYTKDTNLFEVLETDAGYHEFVAIYIADTFETEEDYIAAAKAWVEDLEDAGITLGDNIAIYFVSEDVFEEYIAHSKWSGWAHDVKSWQRYILTCNPPDYKPYYSNPDRIK